MEPLSRQAQVDLVRRNCAAHLIDYVRTCDAGYLAGRLHHFLAAELEAVARGENLRLIITVPPRHGKSRLVSVEFPTWLLGRSPWKKIMLASYASGLSETHSKEARARMQTEVFRGLFPRVRLNPYDKKADDWRTMQAGRYFATSVAGSMTGHGADLLIIDDPHKDYEEAHSEAMRDKVWNWFNSTAMTRLGPGGAAIVITTRWHPDDLVGRLMDPKRQAEAAELLGKRFKPWRHLNLRGLAKEGKEDPLGRAVGEALDPARYPAEELLNLQATLGSYLWAALYDGDPEVKGGNYINVDNFVLVDKSPLQPAATRVRYWDLAATAKKTSDFTAGAKGGLLPGAKQDQDELVIEDIEYGQWPWPIARGKIAGLAERERVVVGVESVGGFQTSFSNLREVVPSDVPLLETGADTDKLLRALPWIAKVEKRRVILVRGPWTEWFIKQCREFPNGVHDDGVDAVSGLYSLLRVRKPMLA